MIHDPIFLVIEGKVLCDYSSGFAGGPDFVGYSLPFTNRFASICREETVEVFADGRWQASESRRDKAYSMSMYISGIEFVCIGGIGSANPRSRNCLQTVSNILAHHRVQYASD